ncbi:hypothetical protein AB4138_05985 [Vibrio sp. 10N.286.52.C3]|uniref:Uncharacterized protein n=1 Tax=Vibrio toranzoniae TaxID=1194427 RepID=A0A109D983_9VIBR|nr:MULTISPECIES: hypothetical protein [Vibrio]KWU01225.1 hypothetical protein APQ14_05865 [Vibrio toranzoniae]MDL5028135.1 hypothetical protein [Vibrio sp. TMPB1044]MDN5208263.1 hypothetical protein [Vibrio sp. TMPB1044]OED77717.1 hypothetical protein A141_21585 [Vibrio crassostreae ZF-91]PTO95327.1 hypothetical protein CWO08_11485 [Vibrio sp. 10N.286.48.B8]
MDQTLLTAKELASRIKFSANYINATLRDSLFIEGKHYIRPFNGRKILYIWEAIERDLYQSASRNQNIIPMAGGRICYG